MADEERLSVLWRRPIGRYGVYSRQRGLTRSFANGKRAFLFEATRKGFVRFISEVAVFDVGYFEAVDQGGNIRQAIKFFFHRVGESLSYVNRDTYVPELKSNAGFRMPTKTEREGLVTSRVGQGAYRKSLIYRWDNRCAVTGYNHEKY